MNTERRRKIEAIKIEITGALEDLERMIPIEEQGEDRKPNPLLFVNAAAHDLRSALRMLDRTTEG